jgi:hypothetical protein
VQQHLHKIASVHAAVVVDVRTLTSSRRSPGDRRCVRDGRRLRRRRGSRHDR